MNKKYEIPPYFYIEAREYPSIYAVDDDTRPDDTNSRITKLEQQIQQRDKDILTLARDLDAAVKLLNAVSDLVIARNALIADIKASQPRIRQRLTRLERMHIGGHKK